MPDQTVKVTFTPPNASSWMFDPNPAHMSAAGKVKLRRDPQSPNWTFVSANGLPTGYTWDLQGNGTGIDINDPHLPPLHVGVPFSVTVSYEGTTYTSPMAGPALIAAGPPPVIMNDGTGRP